MSLENFSSYNKSHCWQYDIRVKNKQEDLELSNISEEVTNSLHIVDFTFQNEEKNLCYKEIKAFIERHEWLGRMSLYPTHFFTARYNGILAGVVIMDMPNAFSKMLGEETRKIERLISRGACISWSPKNLASALISFSMKWMVKNTNYRLFTAYSDVEARELGTIYQACNFYYLGRNSGTSKQFKIDSGRWVSDRYFRSRSVYKKLAINNGVQWDMQWQQGDTIKFNLIPPEIATQIKQFSKDYQNSCESREVPSKHKYAYVLGNNKTETKILRKEFLTRNKVFEYPKQRGQI